ncbi:nucleotidyltransferase [Streptococcus sp. DD12]|uniref:nucleotidyltransferase n=1 Tax=Streptococcus sp. DD12 TaxID=1777880 RepID=UPI00079AF14F|nr:nucleotidyltransferase [Streptococcus sp. DD12]KXT76664.1 UPF0348 protein family [Streptococcus sp. DD12]
MTISGIIAEFNPFHNGHKYLLDQADGLKIVAMSGNFVQRGEPAFIDKWQRAQMALEHGADLVVELPFLVSVQAADYFAEGAVGILASLGMTQLVFGSEQVIDYNALATSYRNQQKEMQALVLDLPDALSYPQKSQVAWQSLSGMTFSGQTPNHVLALAYTKAISAYEGIGLCPVQRIGEGFHSTQKEVYASATALRKNWQDKAFVAEASPSSLILNTAPKVFWDDLFLVVKYQILTHPNLQDILQMNQELAQRFKKAIHQVSSIEELVASVATKRYTKARVRRLVTYLLVQARDCPLPDSIHVLGFSKRGQKHLSRLKHRVAFVTRIGKEPWDLLTQKADEVYRLANPELKEQNYGRRPIVLP